ncbi:MAG TPA: FtsX-like permease family protein [Thermoleophilia bacterium]|nr:FtsX-like permease family protein [Thermoleophilia bacterium]
MTRLAFRSLASRPLRTVLTLLAILLGVAMITGTYVLTDQIDNGFANIFETSFKGTAVQVEPKSSFTSLEGDAAQTMSDELVAQVLAVPGVEKAAGVYETVGAAIVDGEPVETGGSPTLLTTNPGAPFNQATLVAGREIQGRNEVAIIKSFADKAGLQPGDSFTVAAPAGLEEVQVTGVFEWGESGSMGGTIVVAGRLQDVQRWGGEPGRISAISVSAAPGVTPKQLAADVKAAMPAGVSVKTGEQAAADATAETADAIGSFLTPVLLAFAGVSVFVGAFIIFNAFSITVAQRRREFAMLRALGASRRQVLTSVVAEALALGLLASAVGIAAGLGVAKGINLLFKALGVDIPTAGIALEPRTILIAAIVGVGVTLLSALTPALRATRVPPVAALQEGAALPPTRFARFTTAIALAFAALGGGSLAYGIFADGGTSGRLLFMGLGALLLFVAIAMLAKFVVRPASRIIGWPLEKLAPTSGRLARDNAGRNPSRTAATAAALMIGLAMVVFIAVFAQAMKGSFGGAISTSTRADLVAQDNTAYLTVPQKTVRSLEDVPGVEAAAGVAWAPLKVKGGGGVTANAVDPAVWTKVWGPDWRRGGSDALYAQLDASHVILEDGSPIAATVEAGESITVTSQSGKTTGLTVLGFYRDQMAYSGMMVSLDALEKLDVPTAAGMTLVRTDGSAGAQVAVQKALAQYPTQKVETKSEYLDSINRMVDQILMMFYGLLAMSVLISIFGIVNTLVLSVHERTREIGMLRAIGATRRQLRQMVRYESVITAVIGGVLGTLVGIAMGYVLVTQLGGDGLVFSLPWTQLGVFLVLAVVVGVVAAVLPARRAAGTRILEAIQYE